jgi:predicted SnoaL-like aldol condensation-catalyzing enzyme
MRTLAFALAAAAALATAAPALAQGSCKLTPAQVEANKQAAVAFFKPGISPEQRIALLDPAYVQHNPRFKKFAQDHKVSDYEGFKAMMANFRGPPQPTGAGPRPPAPDMTHMVMADCDLVTILHKTYRQDPTAAPGTWYEVYSFDAFRVKNGKMIEHWDGAVLQPPTPGAG